MLTELLNAQCNRKSLLLFFSSRMALSVVQKVDLELCVLTNHTIKLLSEEEES
jgi:hypothetical protein